MCIYVGIKTDLCRITLELHLFDDGVNCVFKILFFILKIIFLFF